MQSFNRIVAAVALMAPAAAYCATPAAMTEADSVSVAAATVMGSYMDQAAQQAYPLDAAARQRFIEGVKDAFKATETDKAYSRGMLEGMRVMESVGAMSRRNLPIDRDRFTAAFDAVLNGESTGFTQASADAFMNEYIRRKQAPDTVSVASQEEFIAARAADQGAVTTPSGLVFKTITEGEGTMPVMTDRVRVMYTGRLSDGTVFDSTDEPIEFAVSNLVPGFTEALTMMKPGGTYRICIPARIGYGTRGISGVIPGNAALDFEVRLLEVLPGNTDNRR
ncbi:MAG: FKBP-type peptidyl-prolyl cis-trans isomerase [Muribaculaceae bacterium]|nr:FKBP-type peptidyl-prolyl cis-trans isomerase [Muribaculaceae bacterium]